MFQRAILILLCSSYALGAEIHLDLAKRPLECNKNIASSQNVWIAEYDDAISHASLENAHRFSYIAVYEDGAAPAVCALVEELNGKTFAAELRGTQKPYSLSTCEQGGKFYCLKWGCYGYSVEYASLEFSNGLRLKSEVHQETGKLHDGHCS